MQMRYGRFEVKRSTKYHIGCQSWGYDDWITKPGGDTVFYPVGTKRNEMLQQYSQAFDTIEIDSTVYGLPPVSNFESWYAKTPPNFLFSLKLPREITHERSLDTTSFPMLEEFLKRASAFREKLGVLLIQLPARFDSAKENDKTSAIFCPDCRPNFDLRSSFAIRTGLSIGRLKNWRNITTSRSAWSKGRGCRAR
jgi:uncharacterized protein YecE (DUF72 family)